MSRSSSTGEILELCEYEDQCKSEVEASARRELELQVEVKN